MDPIRHSSSQNTPERHSDPRVLTQVPDPTPQTSREVRPLAGVNTGACTETNGAGRGLMVGCLESSDFSLRGLFLNILIDFKDLEWVLQGER